MGINVIYDDRHPEDYERLLKEFEEQGITDFKFWDATVNKDSVVGSINRSHKRIIEWAKENNMPFVIVAEQDLKFTREGAWQYFLDNIPNSYDIYLSSTYVKDLYKKVICGFHLYICHSKFYDTFLSVPNEVHIDSAMNDTGGDFHICYPYPALQRIGFSANNKSIVNYNSILSKEDIY